MMFCIWLIMMIGLFFLEIYHPTLFIYFAFSLGSFVAAFLSYIGSSFGMQLVSFFLLSSCFLYIMRYILRYKFEKDMREERSVLVGKKAVVVETLTHTVPGYIRVQGSLMMARSLNEALVQKNDKVSIVAVQAAHVIVKKIDPR